MMLSAWNALAAQPSVASAGLVPSPFIARWSTESQDLGYAAFGPDGPWAAIVASVGEYLEDAPTTNSLILPVYPSGCGVTQLLGLDVGGDYSCERSMTCDTSDNSAANPDDWLAVLSLNSSSWGRMGTDLLRLNAATSCASLSRTGQASQVAGYASVFEASEWNISLPRGGDYPPNVGILGLGKGDVDKSSLLSQMVNIGSIPSNSFGLTFGSAPLNFSASLVLGGYDASRALGPVASLWNSEIAPLIALRDINLGVAYGGSPFTPPTPENLFAGHGDSLPAEGARKYLGAPKGSSIVIPNPATPYISLPPGNCENIASHLPVTWQPDIGFFTWNEQDPLYKTIVQAPTYLEFIFYDQRQNNVSIRVPLHLLDLILEPPITSKPTPYFPCRPLDSAYGVWPLGRAFLQASFLGMNYDTNTTWLAQAPGPAAEPARIRTIDPSDTTIETTPIEAFERSWRDHWVPLPLDEVLSKPVRAGGGKMPLPQLETKRQSNMEL